MKQAIEKELLNLMKQEGLEPPTPLKITGKNKVERFEDSNGKKNNQDGWYTATNNGKNTIYGAFGNHKTINEKFSLSDNIKKEYTFKERFEYAEDATIKHKYLIDKQVQPYGIRINTQGALVIPMHDINGNIEGLQYINPDGKKYFAKKTNKKGNFFIIGKIEKDKDIYLAEGYATAATIHEQTNKAVVIAFDAGNLEPVAMAIRLKFSNKIIIAADNDDEHGDGQFKALKAQKAIKNCKIVIPTTEDYDFNDVFTKRGNTVFLKELKNELKPEDVPSKIEKPVEVKKKNPSTSIEYEKELRLKAAQILDSTQPCKKFDINVLPKILKGAMAEIMKQTDAQPIIILQSLLCSIATLVGKNAYIQYFEKVYPNLYCLTIDKSGNFKTTALNKGAKLVFNEANKITKEIDRLKISKELSKKSKDEIQTINDEIAYLIQKTPLFPSRITTEALVDALASNRGGMVLLSEFAQLIAHSKSSYNEGMISLLTDIYDVPEYRSFETKGEGLKTYTEPFLVINGVSTFDWWGNDNRLDQDIAGGFYPRFLIFLPPDENKIPAPWPQKKDIDPGYMETIKDNINKIQNQKEYFVKAEAKEYFNLIYEKLYTEINNSTDKTQAILKTFAKRWTVSLLKISIIMQICINPNEKYICLEAINAASEVVNYAIKSTTHLFEKVMISPHQEKCKKVLSYIANKGGKVKHMQLIKSRMLEGGAKDYNYIIETLLERGEIDIETKKKKTEYIYSLK